MKNHQKIYLILFFLIIGLIGALLYISFYKKTDTIIESKNQEVRNIQMMKVDSQEQLKLNGIITSNTIEEVRLKVSGKISKDNRSLKEGTSFKKNEILIKVDRLNVLYEILSARSEFKTLIQQLILTIKNRIPAETAKWEYFEKQIQRTQPLPSLPTINSQNEEDLLNHENVYSTYYKTKVSERKAEDYLYIAPFDGTIIESRISSNTTIIEGEISLKIAKKGTNQVLTHVQLKDLNEVMKKDTVEFISSNGETISKGVFSKTGNKLSDSSTVEVFYSIFSQNQNLLNQPIRIIINEELAKIPTSVIKNDSVEIIVNNETYKTKVLPIKTDGNQTFVEGLPQHSYINIHP